jgi:signal peptidase II
MYKIILLVAATVLVGADQFVKLRVLADASMIAGQSVEVVPGLFYISYVENRGMAFGFLQGQTVILSIITGIVLLGLLWYILSGKSGNRFITACVALILAGGAGNLVDRVFRGFVVDYLDFSALFGFPVFNLADCCVVVGTILLLLGVLWSDKKAAPASGTTETEDIHGDDTAND